MSCKAATWSLPLCLVHMYVCAYLSGCVWKGRKQLGVWVLDGGDCAYPCVWLCTVNPCASFEYICLLQFSNDFVLAVCLCVCVCVCVCLCVYAHTDAWAACLYIFTTACTHTSTYVYVAPVINWSRLRLTFSFQVRIEGISLLLTQLVMPYGGITHRPVPSPSKQGTSHHLVSVPMTGDKESREIAYCSCWWKWWREVIAWNCFTCNSLLFSLLAEHNETVVVVDTFVMFNQRCNCVFGSAWPLPHPSLMKGGECDGETGVVVAD